MYWGLVWCILVYSLLLGCGRAKVPETPSSDSNHSISLQTLRESCLSNATSDPNIHDLLLFMKITGDQSCSEFLRDPSFVYRIALPAPLKDPNNLLIMPNLLALRLELTIGQKLFELTKLSELKALVVSSSQPIDLNPVYNSRSLVLLIINGPAVGSRSLFAAMPSLRAVWHDGVLVYHRASMNEVSAISQCKRGWIYLPWNTCRSPNHAVEAYRMSESIDVCGLDRERTVYETCADASHGWMKSITNEQRLFRKRQHITGDYKTVLETVRKRCELGVHEMDNTIAKEFPSSKARRLVFKKLEIEGVNWTVDRNTKSHIDSFVCRRSFSYQSAVVKASAACPILKSVARACRDRYFGVERYAEHASVHCGSAAQFTYVAHVRDHELGDLFECAQCDIGQRPKVGESCYKQRLKLSLDNRALVETEFNEILSVLDYADLADSSIIDRVFQSMLSK